VLGLERVFLADEQSLILRSWIVFADRTSKHDGSSSNPLAASLYGERSIIATNTSGSHPIMTDCFWRKAAIREYLHFCIVRPH
jgi:hypothetical protein